MNAQHPANTRCLCAAVALAGVIGLTGCAAEPAATSIDVAPARYRPTFDAAALTLREHGFLLDRQDYRFGRITTKPRPSPTVLEIWSNANSTMYQAFESTFNDQRRVATVLFEPVTNPDAQRADATLDPDAYRVRVEVVLERYQDPTRRLTGTASGRRMLTSLNRTPRELVERGIEGPHWRAVRRDAFMERKLLAAIVRRTAEPRHKAEAAEATPEDEASPDP